MNNHGGFTVEQLKAAIASPHAVALQKGRNLTVHAQLTLQDGAVADVAIKRFPPPSPFRVRIDRIRGVESKAMRSFRAAEHLFSHNPKSTPEPLGVLETGTPDAPGESWFITRFVPDIVSFKKKLIEMYAASGPCPALMDLLRVVAESCARMHDAGFMHRDLGNQNIMLRYEGGSAKPNVMLLDLNRSRIVKGPLPTRERARDISRINLPSDFLRVFLQMYWRGAVPPEAFLKHERLCRKLYAMHCATRRLRHPLRKQPPCPDGEYPHPRDIWIWDPKSEQAIPALTRKGRNRYRSISRITAPVAALLRDGMEIDRNVRNLKRLAFERSVISFAERVFVSISADPDRLELELSWLSSLGCIGVHVRLYAHEPTNIADFKMHAIRRLRNLNYAVAVSLVQDRKSVLNPESWRGFCERVLDEIHDVPMWVEYLHAINRVKWGVWNFRELETMMAILPELARKYRDVTFIGPAVIDFEWDYLAAALRRLPDGANLGAVSSHLYLDRRGPPEAKQGRFDAVGKLQLIKAMAMANGKCQDHLIVTEFNWPLHGTREWSPVGSPYVSPGPRTNDPSVGEEDAAIYTIRYILLGLCSGLADSMVFWSLAAHGFGLVDTGAEAGAEWRGRPAFKALKVFFRVFRHGHYTNAIMRGENGAWAMQFVSGDGRYIIAAWSSAEAEHQPLPELSFKPTRAIDMYGNEIPLPQKLSPTPVYIT